MRKAKRSHKLLYNLKLERSHKFLRNLKSQMIGQVFIYILAVVLIGFILIYGYNAITTFIEKSNQISFAKLKNDLSNIVEIVSPYYGSVKIRSFEVPGYNKVCFVKNYGGFPVPIPFSLFDDYPIMKDSVQSKVKKNVFLIKKRTEESFFIGDITIDEDNDGIEDDIMCIQIIRNRIKIKFEGKGDHALLAKG